MITVIYENYSSESQLFLFHAESLLNRLGFAVQAELVHPDITDKLAVKQLELMCSQTNRSIGTIKFHSDYLSKGIGLRAKISAQKILPKIISCSFDLDRIADELTKI